MNGRIYDYNVGRFLSVDPFIQGTGSQGINPYSYVLNNPLSFTDPTGYAAEAEVDEVKTKKVAKTGSRLRTETETTTSGTVNMADGSSRKFSITQTTNSNSNGSATTVSISGNSGGGNGAADIGSTKQTATLNVSGQNGGGNSDSSFIDDAFGATKELFGEAAEGLSWRVNAVVDGVSEDFSDGFWEGVVRFTGGRTDTSALEDFRRNYAETSIVLGPIADLDKKATGMLVGGQLAKTNGGMTFGQWAKTGFRPAPHLQTRAATLGYVGRTSAINGAVVTAAYEFGNAVGSGIRVGVNRFARYLADE